MRFRLNSVLDWLRMREGNPSREIIRCEQRAVKTPRVDQSTRARSKPLPTSKSYPIFTPFCWEILHWKKDTSVLISSLIRDTQWSAYFAHQINLWTKVTEQTVTVCSLREQLAWLQTWTTCPHRAKYSTFYKRDAHRYHNASAKHTFCPLYRRIFTPIMHISLRFA